MKAAALFFLGWFSHWLIMGSAEPLRWPDRVIALMKRTSGEKP